MKINRTIILFIILIVIFVSLLFLDIISGSISIPVKDAFSILFSGENENSKWTDIILKFRLPKTLTAITAGIALSVSGLQMQTIFRNPLAGPYVLGISAGAGLGVAIVIIGISSFVGMEFISNFGSYTIIIAAWLGASLVLMLILIISIRIKDIMTILILGILFGAVSSSLIGILQYVSDEAMLKSYVIWTLGSVGNVSIFDLKIMNIGVIAGLLISFIYSKNLNALLLGEDYAKSLGVNIKLTRIMVFISTSLLAGSVTAFCGPVAFIGIAVPHVAKIMFNNSNHFIIIPASILCGAIFLLLSDIISLLPGNGMVLPLNSVTSLLGIPVIIWIIIKNHKISSSL